MSNKRNVRRSARERVTTERGRQYHEQRELAGGLFPSNGDDIRVKWILNSRTVWWPATIVSIEPKNKRTGVSASLILYHKFERYPSVYSNVLFSASSSLQRYVTALGSNDASSWMYHDEFSSDAEGDQLDHDAGPSIARCSNKGEPSGSRQNSAGLNGTPRSQPSNQASTVATYGLSNSTTLRGRSEKRVVSNPPISKTVQKKLSSRKRSSTGEVHVAGRLHGEISDDHHHDDDKIASSSPDSNQEERETMNKTHRTSGLSEHSDIAIRIRLIERQLQDNRNPTSPAFSTSASSVIVSLRWALLRSLEKPLKAVNLPDLSLHGVASTDISVSCQCDYFTFREIAAALAKEHRFAADNPTKSRVAFSPGYHTTQSGSSASDDMNILFSTLADLTAFLRIRDDNDFESILSKEVVSQSSTVLRVLGTLTIDDNSQLRNSKTLKKSFKTATDSTESMNAISDVASVISIFVGSAPLTVEPARAEDSNLHPDDDLDNYQFRTSVFQQDCKHFCPNKKCYLAPWRSESVQSKLQVNSTFYLDGSVENGQLKNYFRINWSRQQAPSQVKWTRDVHDVGSNSPGCLRLTIPSIMVTSSRNVSSLISILDTQIETFMKVRSLLHSSSSFK